MRLNLNIMEVCLLNFEYLDKSTLSYGTLSSGVPLGLISIVCSIRLKLIWTVEVKEFSSTLGKQIKHKGSLKYNLKFVIAISILH